MWADDAPRPQYVGGPRDGEPLEDRALAAESVQHPMPGHTDECPRRGEYRRDWDADVMVWMGEVAPASDDGGGVV